MIDWLVNKIFWWTPLRNAIFDEVHFYDQIDAAIKEEATNLSWMEGDTWYGWTYNKEKGRYYFNDFGCKSLYELLDIGGKL